MGITMAEQSKDCAGSPRQREEYAGPTASSSTMNTRRPTFSLSHNREPQVGGRAVFTNITAFDGPCDLKVQHLLSAPVQAEKGVSTALVKSGGGGERSSLRGREPLEE